MQSNLVWGTRTKDQPNRVPSAPLVPLPIPPVSSAFGRWTVRLLEGLPLRPHVGLEILPRDIPTTYEHSEVRSTDVRVHMPRPAGALAPVNYLPTYVLRI